MAAIRLIIPIALFALIAAVPAVAGRVPMPKIPAAKGAHCVRPTEWMRRNHMKLLMQLRDEAVHEGIRHKRESLPGCIACHVSRLADEKYPSVKSRKFFCNACHQYVGTRIDCFSCHTNRPDRAYEIADGVRRESPAVSESERSGPAAWERAIAMADADSGSASSRDESAGGARRPRGKRAISRRGRP